MSLKIIINQERTIPISMVTREVSCRGKIHSFKIKVICHAWVFGMSANDKQRTYVRQINSEMEAVKMFNCIL